MQKILIIGATSAIAEATARRYASRGARLYLVARNAQRLQDMQADLLVRGAKSVQTSILDVNDIASHEGMLQNAWALFGNIDVALIAHGTLPDQEACTQSVTTAGHEFSTNAGSTIALLIPIANRMQAARRGTIAVISSVAGDRGRASNYLYGASKAAVSTFLSGLRQSLFKDGVGVLTIKPGFVDTPMTQGFKKGALWATPNAVAKGIVRAIDRNKSVVYLPWFWQGIMLVIRTIPEFLFRRIRL
jgi:decaprenylphospho-beta-D-erythro-pentofuranosid-2-ulose 2-reductase